MDCIVSLTTWKGRIYEPTLTRVIYRLLSQKTKYDYKVVLVLSEEEFGKDFELPEVLKLMEQVEKFEILWTYKNTKALKKLDPTMKKYPNVPIITLDDDELVSENMVETMMNEHLKTPNYILGTVCGRYNGIMRVGFIRLFPPNSLVDIPDEYFDKYFKCLHDDEWNGIRAKAKGTKMRKVNANLLDKMAKLPLQFRTQYSHFNFFNAYKQFLKDHKEFR